ncbi:MULTISPECIES: LLM class flavin-dependent oxidoreductase [Streptomyces]|uniref:LLM class flavin-dependent oxidoreductase n=2 Tax=Streptomyces TaxID=1883 RepID=A0A420UVX4_9ACTN|nr:MULTISPECIES: LLM class flavin-dependent oxidoreductase [Streptomyces]KNE82605.1 luciferase [Streptomyces fradiae]OFA51969.1 luciferase [Streptomyces fradiae]PQM23167.1 LLM class flavin-dependent oxidoreductase [Streptomyces xinghaiensis]RKM91532.1 LLM class flavin-dependent oxidoreductase [Streptomyces xinghaiensis]RNC74831.1 LLM class flavin-dependent oxidoreductase [Streptomyces xinghaiensis]
MSPRLSTVILPVDRWNEGGRAKWQRAEELGFHAAYTYDHLSWRSFRDGPWFGALPTLTAAATATGRLRLGTLVTSPNFRHPVTLAKELISLDDISGGRITLGIGAGGSGFDATALGGRPWTPRERADRFGEFVPLLDRLLTEGTVSQRGDFYTAEEARNLPGCVQRPRLPFAVAATGPRGLRLAARHGRAWVTTGDPKLYETGTPQQSDEAMRRQLEGLAAACAETGRDVAELDKILLTGFTPDRARPLESLDAFVDFAGRHRDLGFTEIVVHWPIPGSDFAADQAVFEKIATEAAAQFG